MSGREYKFDIGPCCQGSHLNIWAQREDVYDDGVNFSIDNGDWEGACTIHISTTHLREVARRLYEIAREIESDRAQDKQRKVA